MRAMGSRRCRWRMRLSKNLEGCFGCLFNAKNTEEMVEERIAVITIFGERKGRVKICVENERHPPANPPSLSKIQACYELSINMSELALHMMQSRLNMVFEWHHQTSCKEEAETSSSSSSSSSSSFVINWKVSWNGKSVGFAATMTEKQVSDVCRVLGDLPFGAGVVASPGNNADEDLVYMRALYHRVKVDSSNDSEAFSLINPDSSSSQELTIFFLRNAQN